MDTVDVAAVTKIVKMVGAEFKEASDDDIGFWIELQAPVISRKKFGTDYNLALALLVCHAMKMAGNGDNSLGTISDTGRLASVSEGGVSISFLLQERQGTRSISSLLMDCNLLRSVTGILFPS